MTHLARYALTSSTEVTELLLSISERSPADTARKSILFSIGVDRGTLARMADCWSDRDSSESATELTPAIKGRVQSALLATSVDRKRIVQQYGKIWR